MCQGQNKLGPSANDKNTSGRVLLMDSLTHPFFPAATTHSLSLSVSGYGAQGLGHATLASPYGAIPQYLVPLNLKCIKDLTQISCKNYSLKQVDKKISVLPVTRYKSSSIS